VFTSTVCKRSKGDDGKGKKTRNFKGARLPDRVTHLCQTEAHLIWQQHWAVRYADRRSTTLPKEGLIKRVSNQNALSALLKKLSRPHSRLVVEYRLSRKKKISTKETRRTRGAKLLLHSARNKLEKRTRLRAFPSKAKKGQIGTRSLTGEEKLRKIALVWSTNGMQNRDLTERN